MNSLPPTMLAWPLFGAGLERLGRHGRPCRIPVPAIRPGELLVRIDAIGLCFSDLKLIRAGERHPRVISGDLAADPVIPGHEAVMTVVEVGADLAGRFKIGQRFAIQPDIYIDGVNNSYGYAINGGLAQYSVLDYRALDGDGGCYLLELDESIPSAVAALFEPWTCVLAAYQITKRTDPKPHGRALLVGGDPQAGYQAGEAFESIRFETVDAYLLTKNQLAEFNRQLRLECRKLSALPDRPLYSDIFLLDVADPELAAAASRLGERGACINFIGVAPERLNLDVGSIHYRGWFYQGTPERNLSLACRRNVRSHCQPGGYCWLPGGAGAMGQMHIQLAVETADGPAHILVSDPDQARLDHLKRLLADRIAARRIEFLALNPATMTAEAFDEQLQRFAPDGFDDIIMLVPTAAVLEHAARFLGADGLMNIFAGIPAGNAGQLELSPIIRDGVRFVGSSGSTTADMRHCLELVSQGRLHPGSALAAIGGMNAVPAGLKAVADAGFPGKTVIFPNCPDLPLMPLAQLTSQFPEIASMLDDAGNYTLATEQALKARFSTEP
ncbi:alcohol dehydrogenase catalytic domain-containing protein [Victivallis sp. Marseille-Q1083]|uniref:alcohol dehydrogenase catalytic domain-containing protein n=1 Tax=Victivallis sp. Marseille-Q1083 TaxID=2717288 RepID=UPI00158BCCC9|nr:alcohol dehydrogenase catalytic domain-containing protein [Victivallis sp. Marseille-Q1083]